jgi:hypothetical protein
MAKRKSTNDDNLAYNMLKIGGFLILVILIGVTLIPRLTNSTRPTDEISEAQIALDKQAQEDEASREIENKAIVEKLSGMQERDRMEYYVSSFVRKIENKDYDSAYSLLYDEFKQTYFPTQAEFENYCRQTFPKMIALTHDNIERSGDVYVMFVTLKDTISNSEGREMKFIIQEKNLNEFVISFSVI